MDREVAGLADDHIHSTAGSADAHSTVQQLCRRAVARGLQRICITEHLDFDHSLPEYGYYRYENALRAIESAREQFGETLEIRMGLEVDFESRFLAEMPDVLAPLPVDFLLGAVHVYQGKHFAFFRANGCAEMTAEEAGQLYRHYFAEVRALIRSRLVDCVAHLDYPAKVGICTVDGTAIPGYAEELAETLALAVDCGTGLEVNTRRSREGAPLAAPETAIQQYVALGGAILTLGSDTHHCDHLADGLELGRAALRRAGLTSQTVFRRRQPEQIALTR